MNARIALVTIAFVAAPVAHAQQLEDVAGQGSGSFDLERLRPALSGDAILDVEGGDVGAAGDLDVGLWLNGSLGPLSITNGAGVTSDIVSERASAHLLADYVLVDGFALGVEVPVVVYQNGPAVVPGVAGKNQVAALGLDDVRLVPRLALLSSAGGAPFDLALAMHTTLPTSLPRHAFIGDGLPTVEPELDASTTLGPVTLALDVGGKLRAASRFGGAVQSSELTGRAGASLALSSLVGLPVTLDAAVNGGWLVVDAPLSTTDNPIEALAGLGLDLGPVRAFAAVGTALLEAPGTPALRGLAGVRWSPRCDDADGDGVCAEADRCPGVAEDADGVADSDGCVDDDATGDAGGDAGAQAAARVARDSDGDGIRDLDDACPALAEDPDGALDSDGCPGGDEDDDGFLDGIDRCPSDPESRDNVDDGDGCPEVPATSLRGPRRDNVPLGGAVSFVPATSLLDAQGMLALDTAIAYLKNSDDNVSIDVEPADSARRARKLASLRATAIKKYLVKNGVPAQRLAPHGAGDITLRVTAP